MNNLKRKCSNLKWLLTCGISALVSISAQAGIIVSKPMPTENSSPEMARTLARVGTYTLVGAEQEFRTIPSEVIPAGQLPSQYQGVVYLFNGTATTPERVYQLPGLAHTEEHAGWSVAMSSQWVAFATRTYNATTQAYIYIVGKTNGVWTSCPTLDSVANNCNTSFRDNLSSVSKPITRIPFGVHQPFTGDDLDQNRFAMAISDKYLVLTDSKNSIVKFFRYDATSNNWLLDGQPAPENASENFGKAVAISGERIAVSSTWADNPAGSKGKVRIYQRNATLGTWSSTSQVVGNFASGEFGKQLKMDGSNLVVTSGTSSGAKHLAFYRLDSNGNLSSAPYVLPMQDFIRSLSLYGDTLAVGGDGSDLALTIYTRNAASSTLEWKRTTGLSGNFYANRNASGLGYPGIDDVGVVGDDLSLGWRVFNATTPNLFYGAVLHEKISLLDPCRDPKNLVTNCSFDNVNNTTFNNSASSTNWTLLNNQGGSGSASYTNRELRISIYNPGSDMWHVQARTPVNLSQAVRYKLSFRAKADSNRGFVVNIGHNGNQDNNWQSYGRVYPYATTSWADYSYEFQVPMDANAFLDFNVGNAGTSAVTIDSVSLKAF
jgi:hypothetical protein